ncbi:MAG: AAA family ATPase, partial [Devosia sp.]
MRIDLLYTEPATIEPIRFEDGVNVILGESDETSSKNNGVGKSMCVEFINFALLKKKSDSRVSRIPKENFDPTTFVCVRFTLHGVTYTLKRSLAESEQPRLVTDGRETIFSKVEDATDFLTEVMFPGNEAKTVSFREMLGPLIRDERSEFKSIVSYFDTRLRIPENYAPHLMLLGIDLGIYRQIKDIIKEIDLIAAEEGRIRESVMLVRQKSIDDARSDLNALDEEVETINEAIGNLETAPGFDIVQSDLLAIEEEMATLRRRKETLSQRSARLAPMTSASKIDSDEIKQFFDEL